MVCGRTLIWTVALAPLAIVPSEHVTVPLDCEQVPWEGVAESKVMLAGSVSVTVIPVARAGPALPTVSVVGEQLAGQHRIGRVRLRQRQVGRRHHRGLGGRTVVGVFGSAVSEVTFAWFVIVPAACGVTLIETLALAAFARVPSEQVTVPADCEQLPWEGVAELNVTPAGKVSVRVMPVALEGPALATPTV